MSVAGLRCHSYRLIPYSMEVAMEKNKKQNKKVQFVVVREFSGDKTMREAFEQLIERQTCEHFEEWLEHQEMARKAA